MASYLSTIRRAAAGLMLTAACAAQTPAPATRLTLSQAIDAAHTKYPRVRAAMEQKAAAEAGVGVARTAYLPRTEMLWQTNRATANNVYGLLLPQSVVPSISGPVLPSDNSRSAWGTAAGALVSWQPFDFGVRSAQVSVARQGAIAAGAAATLTKLDVAIAAVNAFLDLATAERISQVAEANLQRLQVFGKSVHVLVDNQLRPGADAAQADAGIARAQTVAIQARTAVEVRRSVLANLVGIAPEQLTIDASELLATVPETTPTFAGVKDHPAALEQSALVSQQQARVSLLGRSYVPQFNTQFALSGRGTGTALNGVFPGGSNGLSPNTMNWAAGVQVTFPAFDWFSLRAKKKVEEASLRADEARYKQTVGDLTAAVRQAQLEFDGARQVAANTPTEVDAARLSEQEQRARFQSSLATVVEVSTAESLLVQAEADDAVARLNAWRALAGVAAAQGDLTPLTSQLKHP